MQQHLFPFSAYTWLVAQLVRARSDRRMAITSIGAVLMIGAGICGLAALEYVAFPFGLISIVMLGAAQRGWLDDQQHLVRRCRALFVAQGWTGETLFGLDEIARTAAPVRPEDSIVRQAVALHQRQAVQP